MKPYGGQAPLSVSSVFFLPCSSASLGPGGTHLPSLVRASGSPRSALGCSRLSGLRHRASRLVAPAHEPGPPRRPFVRPSFADPASGWRGRPSGGPRGSPPLFLGLHD